MVTRNSRSEIRASILVILIAAVLAGCATAQLQLPSYNGPSGGGSSPGENLTAGRAAMDAAFEASRRQDGQSARQRLAEAEVIFADALSANPNSRSAAEMLGMVYYNQGINGEKDGFRKCTEFLERVLNVDPDAPGAARFLALAYRQTGDEEKAIKYANYAESLSTDPEVLREMSELRKPLQEKFLADWNEFDAYYESDAAKVTRLNLQTYKLDLVLQVTPQFENELAAKSFQQIAPSLQISQNEPAREYVQKLVDRLASRSPGPPFTYRVDLVESPEVNAFALPGRILVNTGLIKSADTEAELVAVLSHELAHIYAHHSARQLIASVQNQQIAGSLLALVNLEDQRYQQLLTLGASVGLELLERGYSRQQEKEADKLGTHIAFNAGYNPTFMTSFFVRLFEANPRQPLRLLSTHPPTTDRIEYTADYLDQYPLDVEMQIDSQEFQELKKRLP